MFLLPHYIDMHFHRRKIRPFFVIVGTHNLIFGKQIFRLDTKEVETV